MKAATPIGWTNPAHAERLKVLWAAGLSCSQIAAKLCKEFADAAYSRNAVIGKVHRLGLGGRAKPAAPRLTPAAPTSAVPRRTRLPKAADPPRVRVIGEQQTFVEAPAQPPRVVIDAKLAFAPLSGSRPKPWVERAFNQCSWPVGETDEGMLMSCCEAATPGGAAPTWCERHKAFNRERAPKASKPKDLARSLRRYAA